MPWFIKTETFTSQASQLEVVQRSNYIEKHKKWVKTLIGTNVKIASGYLVNENNEPGGGGLLIFQAKSYEDAKYLIEQDPMVSNRLVNWELHEWIPVAGNL